jgi:hypothetical protein
VKIDQINVTPEGVIEIRLCYTEIENGREVTKFHRTSVEPGADPREQMAIVNKHLRAMNKAECSEDDISGLAAVAHDKHRPDVVAKFKTGKAR